MKVWAIAINTFREAIRNKILYSILLFVVLLLAVSAFFGSVTIGNQAQVIKDFGLFSLSFFGAILTIVSGVSLLNKELKQKTIYNILSKPISRWEFILGKHLGLCLTVCLLVSIMGLGLFSFVGLIENQLDWLLFQAILFSLLEVVVIASLVMFFSSMAVTTTLPAIFVLATYLAGHSMSYFLKFFSEHSSPATEKLAVAFSWLLPDLSLFNVNELIVYGQAVSPAHLSFAVIYCLSYSSALLILSSLIFSHRELN